MKMQKRRVVDPSYFAEPITEVSPATNELIKELSDEIDRLRRPVAYSEPMIEGL